MNSFRGSARGIALLGLALGVTACSSAATLSDNADAGGASLDPDAGTLTPPSGTDAGGTISGHDGGTAPPPPDAGGTTPADGSIAPSDAGGAGEGGSIDPNRKRLVAYLPNYNGSYADWAAKLDFSKMTHMNLAFADPPKCAASPCTANDKMTFSTGDDQDIGAVVTAAHAAGVKVLASIGGGGGDQMILQFYDAGLSTPLITSLDTFLSANGLDGVDLDIESPGNMGPSYVSFVAALVAKFRPQGKLVTAAVASWIEDSMSSADKAQFDSAALPQFDFVNVMAYSDLTTATTAMQYFAGKGLPKAQINLGVPFFGSATDGSGNETDEPEYADILKAYPNAWQTDSVSGGSLDNGENISYVGEATMAKETLLGAQYGGVMIWELTGDAPAPHALFDVVTANL